MVRRFETLAGLTLRRCHEERALRVSNTEVLERNNEHNNEHNIGYNDRIRAHIRTIREIRSVLDRERKVREGQDKMILTRIVHAKAALQQLMLESLESG
mmetsp:Transcript_24452/g.37695  ORF Transcript_24452/g.37695 Transcript_24452/m.37695 type:complete len:99 (+) Transcript_24452:949-1245(+)